jgi:hypothetical protein
MAAWIDCFAAHPDHRFVTQVDCFIVSRATIRFAVRS